MAADASMIGLLHAPVSSLHRAWATENVTRHHYLGKMPDPRGTVEVFVIHLASRFKAGALVCCRPEATRCQDWYGSVDDVRAGRCEVTRWQVLNLARVWIHPDLQAGGVYHQPEYLPGFTDRRGCFRSTLASAALRLAAQSAGFEYLLQRPPCFMDEPYQVRWLLSYCDTSLHRGTIYRAAGWELYRTNERGIQTWRTPVPPLTAEQDELVCQAAERHPRSVLYRARRAQLAFAMENR